MGRIRNFLTKPAQWVRARRARREAREEEQFERLGEILERMHAVIDDESITEEERDRLLEECKKDLREL